MSDIETRIAIPKANGPVKEHSYIVKLKQGINKEGHLKHIQTHISSRFAGECECEITHTSWNPEIFNGYAGKFSGAALDALCRLSDIEYIEPDLICSVSSDAEDAKTESIDVESNATTTATKASDVTQTDAPWGLARLSQTARLTGKSADLNFKYHFHASAGQGVDIYVIGTGVNIAHSDFGFRASWGANFGPGTPNIDAYGQDTSSAGIAIGTRFGVAKSANAISVKVTDDSGKVTASNLMSGLTWSTSAGYNSKRPSVLLLSSIWSNSAAINDTVSIATAWGIHVVVRAGSENKDAKDVSPSNAPTAITVGASNIDDARWSKSNFGPNVDIFAPGESIASCGITGPSSISVWNGTSMAAAHVAGLVAYLIGRNGNIPPAAMKERLRIMSTKNALSGIPQGTVNALARNDH